MHDPALGRAWGWMQVAGLCLCRRTFRRGSEHLALVATGIEAVACLMGVNTLPVERAYEGVALVGVLGFILTRQTDV